MTMDSSQGCTELQMPPLLPLVLTTLLLSPSLLDSLLGGSLILKALWGNQKEELTLRTYFSWNRCARLWGILKDERFLGSEDQQEYMWGILYLMFQQASEAAIINPFYKWGKGDSERFSIFSQVTQPFQKEPDLKLTAGCFLPGQQHFF